MDRTELPYFIVLTIIILLSQFSSTGLLLLLDHVLVRVGLIFALLYLIRIGPTVGLLGLMAICILYLERNRYKVGRAAQKINQMDAHYLPQATVQEEGEPQKTVPVLPFDQPNTDISDYLPNEEMESSQFEPVDTSINQKAVLSTIYPLQSQTGSGSASDLLYEKLGFGHLDGVVTVGDSQ